MVLRLEIKHQTRLFGDLLISMVFIYFLFSWHPPEGQGAVNGKARTRLWLGEPLVPRTTTFPHDKG